MGSGSSRSGRALRRLRGSDSRPAGSGGAAPGSEAHSLVPSSAAGSRAEAPKAATEEREAGHHPGPEAPPDGREETLRLLDQLLAESEAWVPGEPDPRSPQRLPPAAGARSQGSTKEVAKDPPVSSSVSETPDSSHGRPEWPAITYDRSEEELMASIEREYCL